MVAERYRIVARLGEGGMGVVYRADDLMLRQTVALKFLTPALDRLPDFRDRLRREVRLARRVAHPNVCRVFDVGESSGSFFLSMELITGENLAVLLKRIGRLPLEKAMELAGQLCLGLAAMQGAGILHRDLKPGNVMIDGRGRARITDFGLAAVQGRLPKKERRAGTPAYMAPEQFTGGAVTVRSDLYALGLVLFEMFAGRPAFQADSAADYRMLHEEEAPPRLSAVDSSIPAIVDDVVSQCLAKDPEDRPASALDIAARILGVDALQAALLADLTPTPEAVASAPATRPRISNGMLTVTALVLLCIGVLVRNRSGRPWDDPDSKAPTVLLERAREILDSTNQGPTWRDTAFGYCTHDALHSTTQGPSFGDASPRPHELLFWCRRSQAWLVPRDMENYLLTSGRHALNDPPFRDATDEAVMLNLLGTQVARIPGNHAPPSADDQGQLGLTVAPFASRGMESFRLLFLTITLVSMPLAWLNFKCGRVDARSTVLLLFLVFGIQGIISLMLASHVPDFGLEVSQLSWALFHAFGAASLFALLYLALEPLARRHWPRMLVTWNRLLSGRWRDASIGRHVLVGICIGSFWTSAVIGARLLAPQQVEPSPDSRFMEQVTGKLMGGSTAVACYLASLRDAVAFGMLFLLMLALLRALLRRTIPAVIAASLAIGVILFLREPRFDFFWMAALAAVVIVAVWAMSSYGLVTVATALFVESTLATTPMALLKSAWFANQSLVAIGIILWLLAMGSLAARSSPRSLGANR